MRKPRSSLTILALFALSIGFTGCAAPNESQAAAPVPSAQVEANSAPPDSAASNDAAMEGNMYLTGLPLVKEKESFTYLIDSDGKPDEMELFKRFEQETNVHVEWLAYSNEIASEKANLMYSSGDYPDVVGGWLLGDADITRYGMQDGIYIPIDELVAKYAPRMTQCFDEFPGARSALTTPDGHIYSIPLLGKQPLTSDVVHINKKWLEKTGLPMPKTTEEYHQVLKAFKEGDMNGNGKADEIPLSLLSSQHLGDLFGWFGLPDESPHIQIVNGTPTFVPTTDIYKQAVKYFTNLFAEGLLDTEAFTQDAAQFRAKGKGSDVLFGSMVDYYGSGAVGVERYQAEYEPMPVLTSGNGVEPQWIAGSNGIYRTQTAITNKAKNPATIIRWFDYVFGEDNSIQVSKGPYGNLIDRKEDGSFVSIDPPEGETVDTLRGRLSVNSMPYCIMPEISDKFPGGAEGDIKNACDEVYAPNIIDTVLPMFWLTTEESQEISTIATDIGKYLSDTLASWVTGQSDIDAEWDAYVAQLDTLGLQRYMEVYTTAIQRTK